MITFADYAMCDGVAELRRVCFDEYEEESRFFLSRRVTPDNPLVYVEQGRVVASLTLLPVTVVTPARSFPAAYVYAVSTLPGFRRRGMAGALLQHAETVMHARGVEALLLAPASEGLYDYYARFGYRTCFYRKEIMPDVAPYDCPTRRIETAPLYAADLLRLRSAAYAGGGYFVQWDEAALDYVLLECEASGGIMRLLRDGAGEGFFVAYPKYGGVVVKESMLTGQLLPYALHIIKQYFGHSRRVTFYQSLHTPPGDWTAGCGEAESFAMLKCLTPAATPAATAIPYFGLPLD
ncbi:MAG: GNAT family N-acetyltransferase [Prevotellaceae bacterium]|jgi:predicted N-acetyltransferase YhbS|nr:GNAT family N-acetyltransferase [Prevotellaceae bacterium]